MNYTKEHRVQPSPEGAELECLTEDEAAGGADGGAWAPGDAAPHLAGQAGEAGG